MADWALVLLAAGASSRMGRPKQLLEHEGKPLVRRAAEAALGSACAPIVVVVGASADAVRGALAGLPVVVASNPRWADGIGTSIAVGLEAAASAGVRGAILALADQARVSAQTFRRLLAAQSTSSARIVGARYAGTVGVPALFEASAFPLLRTLRPGEGCKRILQGGHPGTVFVDCPEAELDVDTPEDFARLAGTETPLR